MKRSCLAPPKLRRGALAMVVICHLICLLTSGLETFWSFWELLTASIHTDTDGVVLHQLPEHQKGSTVVLSIFLDYEDVAHLLGSLGFILVVCGTYYLRMSWKLTSIVSVGHNKLQGIDIKYLCLVTGGLIALFGLYLSGYPNGAKHELLMLIAIFSALVALILYCCYMYFTMWDIVERQEHDESKVCTICRQKFRLHSKNPANQVVTASGFNIKATKTQIDSAVCTLSVWIPIYQVYLFILLKRLRFRNTLTQFSVN